MNHLQLLNIPETLVKLDLSDNKIGDAEFKYLVSRITGSDDKRLINLNLEGNRINPQSLRLVFKLLQNSNIVSLNVKRNKFVTDIKYFELWKQL